MRSGRLAAGLLVLAALASAARGDDGTVGSLGDPGRWEFSGNKAFTSEQICDGLERDPDLQRALSPSAERPRLLIKLEKRIIAGYRAAGFVSPVVKASTAAGDGKLTIKIEEGVRFTYGEYKIFAFPPLDPAALKQGMQTPGMPNSFVPAERRVDGKLEAKDGELQGVERKIGFDPSGMEIFFKPEAVEPFKWKQGEPFNFEQQLFSGVSNLKEQLARQGYFFAQLKAAYEQGPNHTIDMKVTVVDPGPQSTLGELEVNGCKVNTAETFMTFLGIKQGAPVTLNDVCGFQMRLRESGRFIKHELTVMAGFQGKLRIVVDAEETPGAPALDKPLNDAELAMARLSHWAENFREGEDELLYSLKGEDGRFEVVVNPRIGMAGVVEFRSVRPARTVGIIVSKKDAGFEFSVPAYKVLGPVNLPRILMQLYLKPGTIGFGAGFGSKKDAPPITLDFSIVPATLNEVIHAPDTTISTKDGIVLINGKKKKAAIELQTGRLVLIESINESGAVDRLESTRGRFEKIVGEIGHSAIPNRYDEKFPMGSILSTYIQLMAEILELAPVEDRAAAMGAIRKILTPEILSTFYDTIIGVMKFGKADFVVPFGGQPSSMMYYASYFSLPAISNLFERGNWPWTLSREALFLLSGLEEGSAGEFRRLYQDSRLGPIGCLLASEMLSNSAPTATAEMAALGLKRMDEKAIADDLAALFPPGRPQTVLLTRALKNLASLDEKELAVVLKTLPVDSAGLLKALWEAGRANKEGGELEALTKALSHGSMHDWLEARLRANLTRK